VETEFQNLTPQQLSIGERGVTMPQIAEGYDFVGPVNDLTASPAGRKRSEAFAFCPECSARDVAALLRPIGMLFADSLTVFRHLAELPMHAPAKWHPEVS
jgi:hypothetical protein